MEATRPKELTEVADALELQEHPAANDDDNLLTLPSAEERLRMERQIERLARESRDALAVVEEVYGCAAPDMLLVPRRNGAHR